MSTGGVVLLVVIVVLLLVVGALFLYTLPELRRYLKAKRM